MNNLERVENIWNNLENNFQQSKYENRLDYINHLVGTTETSNGVKTKIDYIIKNIRKDASTYTSEELERMNVMVETLQGVQTIIESEQLVGIEDFDSLLSASIQLSDEVIEHLMPENFLDNLKLSNITKEIENSIEMLVEELYSQFGCLGNTIKLINNKPVSLIAEQTDDFYGLYNTELVSIILEKSKSSEFYYKIGVACNALASANKLEEDILFFSDKYYTVEDNSIDINIGNLNYTSKIYSYHKFKLGKFGTGYFIPVETPYGKIKMMFL